MGASRTVTAVVGLLLGLLVSVAAWIYFDTFLLFLFLPFVPLLAPGIGRRGDHVESGAAGRNGSGDRSSTGGGPGPGGRTGLDVRRCPRCGFRTDDPGFEYYPRDGSRLRE
ncbi:hypothetical protein ACFQGT_15125 [Natrialbaceae archaeon GCM10025810]|uniref:hypothetical protein n=1 Tax=Halovalidus salilacus TaxID=3075124 RepID=UPI003609446D